MYIDVFASVDAWQALGNSVKRIHPAQNLEANTPVQKW